MVKFIGCYCYNARILHRVLIRRYPKTAGIVLISHPELRALLTESVQDSTCTEKFFDQTSITPGYSMAMPQV